jgi:hypothetical protein
LTIYHNNGLTSVVPSLHGSEGFPHNPLPPSQPIMLTTLL